MLRVLFLLPVVCFVVVSATFNVLFSATLGHSAIESGCWVALGIGAAVYSGLAFDIIRTNWRRGSPAKAVAGAVFLVATLGWDARCARGFADMEAQRAKAHVDEIARKRASAEAKVRSARIALEPYVSAIDPAEADTAVDAIEKRTNDQRCAARTMPDDVRKVCDQLTEARLAATRAHAKVRRTADLAEAERTLDATTTPPARDNLADVIPPELVKWLPALVLQIGLLFGTFAAAIPGKPRAGPPTPPAPTPTTLTPVPHAPSAVPQVRTPTPSTGSHAHQVVATVAELMRDPDRCPPGLGINAAGWLQGPQRKLATLLKVPVSVLNRELKQAASTGALELDTSGGVTRMRVTSTRH